MKQVRDFPPRSGDEGIVFFLLDIVGERFSFAQLGS